MRTESKVDSIVLDWLREGLSEKLDQLLRALEDLSGGTGGAEHIYESLQAVKTMDAVLSIADFQVLRVLLKEEMAALVLLETKPPQVESLLYAVTEAAWLLRSIFDRLSIGATVNAMSLVPMINRLRSAQSLPLVDTENVLARASIIWSESRVFSAPYRTEDGGVRIFPATATSTPKVLLTQMEQQILQLLRGNTVIISDLLKTFDLIIDNEVNPAVIVATRVFEELLNAIHDDQARYLPLAQRVIGRILKLFRMELQGREALQIRHEAIEFATDLLLELLKILPDDRVLCGEGVGHWREILSTTGERTRFLGLESDTLKQVAEALSEELNAAQDVLDIFVRGAKTDLEPLVRIQPRLEQIIGVLDTLNYADEAKLIQAALNRLVQVVRGAELLDDDFLMELAVAVMTSEQVVSQIGQFIVEVGDRPSMIDRVVRQSRLALATACYEDILAAKEIVNKSLSPAGPAQTAETLADAVGLVHGVRNALSVAELTAAMPLIEGLHEWLSLHADRLNQLTPKSMSALAEVSAAIEFYLENLRDYQKELIQYLDGPKAMLPILLAPVPASAESFALEMAASETDSVVDGTADTDRDALSLSLDEWSPDSMPQSSAPAIEPELPVDESLASIDDLIAQLSGEDAAHIDSTEHTLTEFAQDVEPPLIEETDPAHQPVPTAEFDEATHRPADITEASIDAQALPEVLSTSVDSEAAPVADPSEPSHEMFPPLDLAEVGAAPVDQDDATASPSAVDESETLSAWEDEAGQAPSTQEEAVVDSLAWPELDAGAEPAHQPLDVIESAGLEGSDSVEEDLALPWIHGEAESPVPMAAVDDIVDEELDPLALEMRMVFAEEMADTLPEMQDASNRWLASGDRDDLAVLRRGFHTIKGSSRMVGLTMIGDWGWSYENLLTRVLDGRTVATEPLRADVSASVLLVASALPVLEKGREPPVSFWQASQSAAERWTSTQDVSSDSEEMDNDEFDSESIAGTESAAASEIGIEAEGLFESADNSGETFEAEGISVPELDGSIQEEKTAAAAIVGIEHTDLSVSVEPQTALPVIDDPILREIFDTESSGYIQQLQQQITHAMDNHLPLACDKELVRLVHTLLGSARTAGVQPIANIADRLEEWVQLLEEHQRVLEYVNLDVFRQALIVMDQIRLWAIDPNFPQPDSHPIEMRIATKIDEALAQIVPNSACDENEMQGTLVSTLEADERELTEEALAVPFLAEDDGFFGQQPVAEFLLAPRPDDQPAEQDPDILQIFLEEAEELLEKADGYIAHWRSHPHDLDSIRLLHRNLHTLKGGARMAGLLNLADVTHLLEDRLDRARDQGGDQAEQLVVLVQQTYDALGKMLDLVRRQESVPAQVDLLALIVAEQTGRKIPAAGVDIVRTAPEVPEPLPVVASHEQPSMAYAPTQPEVQSAVPVTPAPVASLPEVTAEEPQAAQATSTAAAEVRREQIRVDADRIDSLVNQVGENVLLQARVDRQVSGFERQLFELQQTLSRLRGQLRRLEIETESQMKTELMVESGLSAEEFDPLEFDRFTHVQELSRGIMESLGDISSIEEAMSDLTEQSQLLLLQQSRLGRKLQDGMLALRMVRFNDVVGRLRRIVRQVGDEVGRSAELVVHNGETELDRVTLVGLLPSLEHMIRNSLAHGIEQAEERRAKGKPEMGKIEITIESSGGNVTLELKDDGRGLDLDTIRRKAIERKLITEDIELTDDEARSLIFLPGFSTAGNVSQVSGRGVGMDVVAGSVREMGGFVDLQSEYGVYTRIQLNLPLTQAMTRGILVSVGDERFAIPYKGVVSVTRMTTIQLAEQYASDKPAVTLGGERYPLFSLGELMTHEPFNRDNQETGIRPVFLFKLGERRFAIQVDHQLGGIQLFVKSLGPQLGRIPGLSGATIADDGNVILVLELFELVRQFQRRDDREVDLTAVLEVRRRPMILVVDDSLTVRKVTARTLERNNLDVILARDGVEALGVLHEQRPDLVLTDIEMPRMDGFELLGAIRNDPQTRSVPVIMISSRTGQKHRSRAEALGVSAYLGKPYAEADLITRIEQFIADKRGALLTTDSTAGMAQTVKGDWA
ncbi:MAG TPA: Hpt domain-containing protein [Halothiobacillus sp.]|nr:Hpt domain-containing protein [Halothiobacillus sp.]